MPVCVCARVCLCVTVAEPGSFSCGTGSLSESDDVEESSSVSMTAVVANKRGSISIQI